MYLQNVPITYPILSLLIPYSPNCFSIPQLAPILSTRSPCSSLYSPFKTEVRSCYFFVSNPPVRFHLTESKIQPLCISPHVSCTPLWLIHIILSPQVFSSSHTGSSLSSESCKCGFTSGKTLLSLALPSPGCALSSDICKSHFLTFFLRM